MGRKIAVVVLVLLIATTLAGCIDAVAPVPDAEDGSPEPSGADGASSSGTHGSDATNDTGNAGAGEGGGDGDGAEGSDTGDGNDTQSGTGPLYTLPLSPMRWAHTELVVLVVPPAYGRAGEVVPGDSTFLRAVEDSIQHWQEAIDEHGSKEISGNVTFDVYVLGRDIHSPTLLPQVDITISNLPGGIVLAGLAAYPLSPRCVIANFVNPLQSYEYMFMVSAHEFGHCLGLSHPDDHEPWYDLMSYSYINQGDADDLELDCVSNLNLMAVHEAFAPAFDRQAQSPVQIHESDYRLIDCADRFLDR